MGYRTLPQRKSGNNRRVIVRLSIVYVIGVVSLGVGFFEFWHRGTANQTAIMVGTTCLVGAATIHVIRDLWHRLRRVAAKQARDARFRLASSDRNMLRSAEPPQSKRTESADRKSERVPPGDRATS
jgi:hypothetical protein